MKSTASILIAIILSCCSTNKENNQNAKDTLSMTSEDMAIDSVSTANSLFEQDTLNEQVEDNIERIYQFTEVSAEEYEKSDGAIAVALAYDPNTPKDNVEVNEDESGNPYETYTQPVGTLPATGLQVNYSQGYENQGFSLTDPSSGRDYSIITAEFPDNPMETPDGSIVLQSYSDMGGETGLRALKKNEGKWSTLFDWSPWSEKRITIGLVEVKWHTNSLFYLRSGRNIYGELPPKYYKVYLED